MLNFDVSFDLGSLNSGVHVLPERVERLIAGVMLREEGNATSYMKSNARWRDRTANARNGLAAEYTLEGDTHVLTLHHGVAYGIWLEVRYAGRYAIILESVQHSGSSIMGLLDRGMARL